MVQLAALIGLLRDFDKGGSKLDMCSCGYDIEMELVSVFKSQATRTRLEHSSIQFIGIKTILYGIVKPFWCQSVSGINFKDHIEVIFYSAARFHGREQRH